MQIKLQHKFRLINPLLTSNMSTNLDVDFDVMNKINYIATTYTQLS